MLNTKAIPLQIKLLAAACALSLAAIAVSEYGNRRYDIGHLAGLKAGRGELAIYRQQVAEQRSLDAAAAMLRYQTQANALLASSQQLMAAEKQRNTLRDQLKRRLPDVAQAPSHTPGQPTDGLLSVSGLQFYNDALGIGTVPTKQDTAATVQSDAESPATSTADSGVRRTDLLAHAADYGQWCQALTAQRDALIDAYPQGENDEQHRR